MVVLLNTISFSINISSDVKCLLSVLDMIYRKHDSKPHIPSGVVVGAW